MVNSLDPLDRKIVRTFQEQPEISIADLADAIGLSQTPTWRRVKRLRNEGIFLKKAMIFDAKKLGFSINVLASVRLHRHDEETLEALERAASEQGQILECFSMSGESDYVMRIVAEGIEEYEQFLKKVILHLPGVASVSSSFTLKTIKSTTNLPV